MKRAAVGLRAHSGWAALVVVAGSPAAPEVIDRRRIEIADPGIPGSKQPYHAAEELDFAKARALLKRCEVGARRLAREAFRAALADARAKGHQIVGCGLLLASGRPLPPLESILASHALIHTADGEHFRDALTRAAEGQGLEVLRVPERELSDRAAAELRMPAPVLQQKIAEMGRRLGAPWTQDQKLAALIACLALAGAVR